MEPAAQTARAERDRRLAPLDLDRAPFTIAWELTRACAYACAHCRADAQPRRHPGELTTAEAHALVDDLAGFGTRPILVLTGGDPLMRRDVFEIAAHADAKITAAPQHRRIALERAGARAGGELAGAGYRFADGLRRPAKGVNDGRGFLFVSHLGEVMPSGFLPLSAGDVRRGSAVRLYRDAPLFRRLRDPDALRGRCGACEYREVCGGSRARAYAVTGDPLAEGPSCPYEPSPVG